MMASDVILTKVVYAYPFVWDHFVTWAWYAAVLWLGTRLRANAKPLPVMGAALASSVSFFVISNFAVWAAYDMYPKNFGGLMTSYALALPFFRHAVEGDLLFTAVVFCDAGSAGGVVRGVRPRRPRGSRLRHAASIPKYLLAAFPFRSQHERDARAYIVSVSSA